MGWSVQPASGTGGGPKPGGAARAEPAACGAARAEPSVDGNHLQHPAGDCHPYGILCLQAYSSSVTAKQVLLQIFWEQDKLCCTQVNGEVGMQTFLLGNDLWSGQLVNAK